MLTDLRKWTKTQPIKYREAKVCSLVVGKVLGRANISGIAAHPHAFRKGVITSLLRSGNAIDDVAIFVHHKDSKTTSECYDMRSYAEVVGKMKAPTLWTAEDRPAVPGDGKSKTSEGTVDALREATEACADSWERIEQLEEERQIMLSILTPEQKMALLGKLEDRLKSLAEC